MQKILVVVDMQNDFIDGALGSKEAVGIVDSVVEKIKNSEGHIIVTLDTHNIDYLHTQEGKMLPVPHCIKMTQGWMLQEKVFEALAEKSYTLVEKKSFGSTKLEKQIRKIAKKEEAELELIGLCSDICVVSNALILKANFPEWKITVDAACCAGVTVESHKAALQTMKACQINIVNF